MSGADQLSMFSEAESIDTRTRTTKFEQVLVMRKRQSR